MNLLKEVSGELYSMFVSDAALTACVLAIVAAAALIVRLSGVDALVAGVFLAIGCMALVVASVWRAARAKR